MQTITATELARRLREVLDGVEFRGEAVAITRNKREIAQLLPGAPVITAAQAFSDLFAIVDDHAAKSWRRDSRGDEALDEGMRDPWDT